MRGVQVVALIGALGVVGFIVELVRRREIREKYALLWIVLGIGIGALGLSPGLLDWLAPRLGIAEAPNLLYFVALLILLVVVAHLTWEVSRLEKETRTLAEEIGILRLEGELRDDEAGSRARGGPPNPPPGG